MKGIILACFALAFLQVPVVQAKSRCKQKSHEVSCQGVKGAQKDYFCSKKNPSEEKRARICQKAPRSKMKHMKKMKRRKAMKNSNEEKKS